MDVIRIEGGVPLHGTISVSGAKNSALPALCTALLADGTSTFRNVPDLRDIATMAKLLEHLGAQVETGPSTVSVTVQGQLGHHDAPYELVKQMRASVLVLGPLVARYGYARVSLPGGCAIGARPIDQHLKGLEAMGAEVALDQGYVNVRVPSGRLRGAQIHCDVSTVTGTENLMCAAVLAQGQTIITNAAREPEIEELAKILNKMGARIQGAGTHTMVIEGCDTLKPVEHTIMPDRIEAGTYMIAAAATQGNVLVENVVPEHVESLSACLRESNVAVERERGGLRIRGTTEFHPIHIVTAPFPGFPTDMQAQLMVLMSLAEGTSTVQETIFENRFMHVAELMRLGAHIEVHGNTATVHGPCVLQGATVMATDLRASACLVVAGLVSKGTTDIRRVYHLDRGYEHIEQKLVNLGARISRRSGRG